MKQRTSIQHQNLQVHKNRALPSEIVENTAILRYVEGKQDLFVAEALIIKEKTSTLNTRYYFSHRKLKIF